jgi:hypothetical protein
MTRLSDIKALPVSEAVRLRNPHLFATRSAGEVPFTATRPVEAKSRRLRQDTKPLMNALETRLLGHLQAQPVHAGVPIRPQAKRYRLANGLWYKPDFTAILGGTECAWEAKGPKAFRGGFENLKMAAAQWPEVMFFLMWEDAGVWKQQMILP